MPICKTVFYAPQSKQWKVESIIIMAMYFAAAWVCYLKKIENQRRINNSQAIHTYIKTYT